MQKVEIKAEPRTIVGRRSKTIRKQGLIPAVMYGRNFEAQNIQMPVKAFEKVYAEAGESTLVYLKLGDETHPTIIHDVGVDPVYSFITHADFYRVRLDEKINADIPVKVSGDSPAVKDFGGILVKNINEIEVEGFPQDLPHEFIIDISVLKNIGDEILVKDLIIPANIVIKSSPSEIIALIQEPISEEQLKESLEGSSLTADDVEVIEKEKKEEEVSEDAGPAASSETSDTQKDK